MAPVGDDPLASYLDKDVPKLIEKYDKLWEVCDPEENPYKTKYEARELLEDAVKELERLLPQVPAGSEQAERGREALARFQLFLGKNYYFCEEVPIAEQLLNRSLERFLTTTDRLRPECFISIQDCFNQLGALWCNRQGHGRGMNYLRRSQIMFEKRPDSIRTDKVYGPRSADNYTLTMFYLAQAYGPLNKPALSARFCAETMSQQLDYNTSDARRSEVKERDPFDCKDWVRNCCSLSDFFVNEAMFWTAEYLLHSAAIMCERCEEICGTKPENLEELQAECNRDLGNYYSTRLKFFRTCAQAPGFAETVWRGERKAPAVKENTEGSRLTFACSADVSKGEAGAGDTEPAIVWDDIFPEVVHLEDEEADDNRLAEEHGAEASTGEHDGEDAQGKPRAVGWLEYAAGERVCLPVHFRRLHAYVERRIRKANAGFIAERSKPLAKELQRDEEEVEEAEQDPSLPKPSPMPSSAGPSFEAAREVFKIANHYQLKSLGYYILDGFVTDHVRILQELSQMYRTLLWWELDHKRAGAMMTRRTRMLAPLLEVLNPKVYIAFWRQLSFEVAEVMQQIYELRAHGKLPEAHTAHDLDEHEEENHPVKFAARLNNTAQQSLKYFSTFIESYHERGKIPDKIEDEQARVYLVARLNRARLLTKMRGLSREDSLEAHKSALREYEWLLDYGRRNPDAATKPEIHFGTELALCQEMAGMLPSKLDRIAAGRR